jgi:hypothetical protein
LAEQRSRRQYVADGFNQAISLSGSPPPNRVVLLQFSHMDAVKAYNAKEQQLEADVGNKYASFRAIGIKGAAQKQRKRWRARPAFLILSGEHGAWRAGHVSHVTFDEELFRRHYFSRSISFQKSEFVLWLFLLAGSGPRSTERLDGMAKEKQRVRNALNTTPKRTRRILFESAVTL